MEDRTLSRIDIVKDSISNLNVHKMIWLYGRGYPDLYEHSSISENVFCL